MIKAYTDGACLMNGYDGPVGWSFLIADHEDISITDQTVFFSGGDIKGTNNRAELLGVLEALKWIERNKRSNVIIYSDSMYCVKLCNNWSFVWAKQHWKKRGGEEIANLDLIKPIHNLYKSTKSRLEWIKGHNGNVFNEYVDQLATKAALQFAEKRYATFDSINPGDRIGVLLETSKWTHIYTVSVKFHGSTTIVLKPDSDHADTLVLSQEEFDKGKYIKL